MSTRKQRKRREKEQRHEYVWQDAEGNILEPEEAAKDSARSGNGAVRKQGSSPQGRGGRVVQPPSWSRTFKRALIFAPVFLIVILLLNGNRLSLAGTVLNAILLVVVFVPFSYMLDKLVYRQYQKRQEKRS
jgi:hypothetical protein